MSYGFQFQADASLQSIPGASVSSGIPALDTPFNINLTLSLKISIDIDLSGDDAVTVALPGPSGSQYANVLMISIQGPRVKATITTADGSAQVLPVDSALILFSTTVSPITALTLTRTPGVDTLASVFLGQI